jgi:hypothetical protein
LGQGASDAPGEGRAALMTEWTITINAPDRWLTANDRSGRRAQAAVIAAWRRAAFQMAQAGKLPKGLVRVRIEPTARFSGRAPVREAPNLAPTIKAAVDGLGPQDRGKTSKGMPWIAPGYGLVPDDSDQFVDLAQTVIGERLRARQYTLGHLVLRIIDLSAVG